MKHINPLRNSTLLRSSSSVRVTYNRRIGMAHNNRAFDRQSYMQNDARAKKAIVNYLIKNMYSL